MDYISAVHKLQTIEQQQILQEWDNLSEEEKKNLLKQVALFDVAQFRLQRSLLQEKGAKNPQGGSPLKNVGHAGNVELHGLGMEKLRQGKVGCLVVAGGQGSRLGYNGPKGEVPVSLIRNKSLFQLIAEKTLAASKQVGHPLSLAIMTSPLNHQQTVAYFRTHAYFGLDPTQIDFFSQEMLPFLDQKGDLFLETKNKIAEGPDGNGTALKHFLRSGIWEKWKRKGIESMVFTLVDNPLADPFDPELIGFHTSTNNEVTIKAILREDPAESVGVLMEREGKVRVIEYSEISDTERLAVDATGGLKYKYASISLFALDLAFVQKVGAEDEERMPYHLALKAAYFLNAKGETVKSKSAVAWKFEKFIFDFLPLSKKVGIIAYPRKKCYAPLKNAEGPHSLKTVQEALLESDRTVFSALTGKEAPAGNFELAQEFYYPTPELLKRWNGRTVHSNEYVEL